MKAQSLCSLLGNTIFSQLEHDCIARQHQPSIVETIEAINQKIVEKYTRIASTITFSENSLVKAHYIAEAMLALGEAAGKKQNYEVSMFMLSDFERDLSDGIYIDDVVVGKKQVVHPALCDVSGEGVHHSEEDAKDNNMRILGWAHSHAKMPVFYSGTDDRQMKQLIQYKGWPVGLDVFDEGSPNLYARLYPALVVNGAQALPSLRVIGDVPQLTYSERNGIGICEKRIDFEQSPASLHDTQSYPNLIVEQSEDEFTEQDRVKIQQDLRQEVTFNDGTHLGSVVDKHIDFVYRAPSYIKQHIVQQESSTPLRFEGNLFSNRYEIVKVEFEKRYGMSSKKSYGQIVGSLYVAALQEDPLEQALVTQITGVLSGLSTYDEKKQWEWSTRCKSIERIVSQYENKLTVDEKQSLVSLSANVLRHKYLTKKHRLLQTRVVHALTDLCLTYTHVTQQSA